MRETFGDPEGMGILDESGCLQKSAASVDVQQQDSGTAGKVEHCQIGVSLTYATARGHVFLDRRLYRPEAWCDGLGAPGQGQGARGGRLPGQAGASDRQAGARLGAGGADAAGDGGRIRWRRAPPAGNGRAPRPLLRPCGPVDHAGLDRASAGGGAVPRHRGPATDEGRLAPGAPPTTTVATVLASWPTEDWQRSAIAKGEQGPRVYDWGRARASSVATGCPVSSSGSSPAGRSATPTTSPPLWSWPRPGSRSSTWRRSLRRGTPWNSVAKRQMARSDWTSMRSAPGRAGTATAPCRCWRTPGWPRFAVRPRRKRKMSPGRARLTVPAVRRRPAVALPLAAHSPEHRLAWSHWRRAKRWQARRSHYRRRTLQSGHATSCVTTTAVVLASRLGHNVPSLSPEQQQQPLR